MSRGKRHLFARAGTAAVLAIGTALVIPAASADAAGPNAVQNDAGCTANALPANDDGSTGQISLAGAFPSGLNFFGQNFSSLYANNNGNVTFTAPMSTYTPFSLLSTHTPMIAPFFGDVDTRGQGSDLLRYGTTTFEGRPAFCATWAGVGVGYYSGGTDKLNSFQMLLVNRSDRGAGDFDIVFNYDQIQWEAGSASGGIDGLGGTAARAGYSNGVDRALELPGSGQNGALLDTNATTGLIHNLSGQGVSGAQQLGRYVFPVENGQALSAGSISGAVTAAANNAPVSGATVSACTGGSTTTASSCQLTQTNSGGGYVLAGLAPGNYNVHVSPPGDLFPQDQAATVSGTAVTVDFSLGGPVPPPPGTGVSGTGSRGTTGGTPVVVWYTPFDVTAPCASPTGTGTVQILENGNPTTIYQGAGSGQTVPMVNDGNGHLVAAGISTHDHGNVQVVLTLTGCGAGDGTSSFDMYIDPSGQVLDQYGRPIGGTSVTLLRSDTAAGPFEAVPDGSTIMSAGNRSNPMTSGADGSYGWDTVPGYYRILAAAPAGCSAPGGGLGVESDVLQVPPAQTGINLVMNCTDAVGLSPATATSNAGTVQSVNAAVTRPGGPVNAGNVLFTVTGANPTTGSVPVNGGGAAAFTWPGTNSGTDTVTACYDRNGNNACDAGEPTSAAVTRTINAVVAGPTCNGLPATIVSNASVVYGTPGNDVIVGGPANQQIYGLGGDDVICGGDGNDVLNGGDGNDWLDGQGGMDMIIGGPGNDIEHGGAGTDKIGGSSNDPGIDTLIGDAASDQCFGTTGVDAFDSTCESIG